MKILVFLVCWALVVKSSWCDGISIIGSKYIRPNRPYTVAFANPLNKNVKLNLSLQCNEFDNVVLKKESTFQLSRVSGKKYQFFVPSIANTGDVTCTFSAVNAGGEVIVDHDVELEIPEKTASIFIQTDKPVYKPGDVLRFRVVVVDIETKPVTNIKMIEVLIKDTHGKSVRHWTFAKLNKGIFESSYQMGAVPVLGTWTISVTAKDDSISNKKQQTFEVMEYVLPKFAVKVWPTKTLLTKDRMISVNIESHYTFGQRVEGMVQVNLYLKEYSLTPDYKKIQKINGNTVVEFRLKEELDVDDKDHKLVNMTVAVTDSFSNVTVNITQQIPVYLNPYKISLVKSAWYYRPGAPYHLKLSVKDHTGLALPQGKAITIIVDGEEFSAPLDGQGLASFVIPTPDEADTITLSARFDSVDYEDVGSIEALESSSMQYLQIHSKQRIIAGRTSSFTISSNEPMLQLWYCVVTRGSIVDFGYVKSGKKKTYALKLKLTDAMAPKATLVVFFVKEGKFIADYFNLVFDTFGNDFEFKLDEESYRPDQEIYVEGKAQNDSVVVFQAIDESALLLGHTEYGLTKQGILDDLDQYSGIARDNEFDWFSSVGLFFRSDSIVDEFGSSRAKRSPLYHPYGQRNIRKPVLLRLDFPEAWLWRNISMNNRDTFQIEDLVPDTITSWQVTGFALSPSRGLGIMNHPRKFTVGKTFYMIAHLPYSIKRGEVALIQVTLYNFLGNTVTTDVTLFNKNDEIEFVEKSSKDDTRRSKAVVLPSHQVKPISFLIRAKKLGEIAIKIEAVNDLTSDGLEHMLRVTPESREQIKNEARFIELKGNSNQSFDISCNIPRAADPGSIKIKATIDHDLIGIPSHSKSLINIPKESGDLNLLTFIPNIVALDFLSSPDSEADETLKQKAIDALNMGYDNQLRYKRSNGAFRQWISETSEESIFLTALVANAFVTASKYIKVDAAVIDDAFSWLASKQNTNGCFKEVGEVVYSPMQDDSSSIALTAFVVAAFKENHNISVKYEPLVEKAVKCLADNFDGLRSNYHIALATYALSLANHPKQLAYLNKLMENSIRDDKERYWDEGSLSIEIAGYALLSYIAQNLPLQDLPIYKWLSRQRYSNGEFAGVQSTFVGLKAMAKMAHTLSRSHVNYRVQIKSKNSVPKTWNLDINRPKPLDLTVLDLPDSHRVFEINFDGTGYGFFQLSYQYNLNIGIAKQSFNLRIELLKTSNYEVQDLKVCLNYKPKEAYQTSNKALVEVYLPSGLAVNDNAVRDLSPGKEIKKTVRAFDGSAMYVYYNTVGLTDVCFVVTAHRQFKIAMHRPAYVVVYDTEDKDRFALATYEGIVLQVCDICENEDCATLKC